MGPKKRGDPDPFFPDKGQSTLGNKAVVTCFGCIVGDRCDEYKRVTGSKYGIWNGKYSER